MSTKTRTRKGRNPVTGATVSVPVRARKAVKAKKAVKRVAKRNKHLTLQHTIDGRYERITFRLGEVEINALENKARELDLTFSEIIRQGLREHYQLPEAELKRKEKVISG